MTARELKTIVKMGPPNSWAWEIPEDTGGKEMPQTAKAEEEIAKFTVSHKCSSA